MSDEVSWYDVHTDTFRVSHSEISVFQRCRRQFYYSTVRNIQAPEKLWGPRPCGSRVHASLQEYLQRGISPVIAHQRFAERDEAFLLDGDQPGWVMDEFYADIIMGRNCCIAWERWVQDEGIYDGYEVQSEVKLEAPMLDGRVILIGKVDVILTRLIDGVIMTEDFKTASPHTRTSLPPTLEKSYQHHVYQILAAATNPNMVDQALYTVLYKLKIPERATHPLIERFHVPGHRAAVPHRRRQIEHILEDMLEFIDRVRDDETWSYPTPGDSCRWCDYKHPCQLQDEVPLGAEAMLAEQFIQGGRHARYETDLGGDE